MNSLTERDSALVWHPFTPLTEPALGVVRAQGAKLYLEDGRVLIDAISSWWTNIHGHCNPTIAQAIAEQVQCLDHVLFAGFTHAPAVELSEALIQALGTPDSRVFFSDNGSTAVEVALKIAIQYWWNQGESRHSIISFSNGYHGDTFGAMSVSGRGLFTSPYGKHLFEVRPVRAPEIGLSDDERESLLTHFEKLVSSSDTAAFIFEPLIQGSAGMRLLDVSLLNQLVSLAKRYHVPVIADEVMTGFFRTGLLFACEYLNHPPDIRCLSKGITGGALPLGVTTCCGELVKAFNHTDRSKMFFHGHSYTANPIACAAALASLKLCLTEDCQENVKRICARHEEIASRFSAHPRAQQVRRLGTILAFTIASHESSGYLHPLRDKLYSYFIESGVLLRPLGDVVYIMPPYCISDSELDTVYDALMNSLEKCL